MTRLHKKDRGNQRGIEKDGHKQCLETFIANAPESIETEKHQKSSDDPIGRRKYLERIMELFPHDRAAKPVEPDLFYIERENVVGMFDDPLFCQVESIPIDVDTVEVGRLEGGDVCKELSAFVRGRTLAELAGRHGIIPFEQVHSRIRADKDELVKFHIVPNRPRQAHRNSDRGGNPDALE